jgi:hypothetical protein
MFSLLKSYLTDRTFLVKHEEAYTELYRLIWSPAGKYPWAYVILHCTADLPITGHALLATYADDTTILASHENPIEASRILQMHLQLDQSEEWLK